MKDFASPKKGNPRLWNEKSFIPFRLETLTPVFVGSGDDFSPLEYIINKKNNAYALHLIDTNAWLLTQRPGSPVLTALENGDLLALRSLLDEQFNSVNPLELDAYSLARIPIPNELLAENLLRHIRNRQSNSKAEIMSFTRDPFTHTAFLPGSSLKGSISTPLIDYLDQRQNRGENLKSEYNKNKRGYNQLLEKMFGKITESAMQALKVPDIVLAAGGTILADAVEKNLDPEKAGTPKTPCEVLPAQTILPLYGSLRMDASSGNPAIILPDKRNIGLKELARICLDFYRPRFRSEMKKFYSLPHFNVVKDNLKTVSERIDSLKPEEGILLRVGHYSHIESVTVTNNQPDSKKGFGQTRTLADGLLPFGWILLRFCKYEEYEKGIEAVEKQIETAMTNWRQASLRLHKEIWNIAEQRANEEARKAEVQAKIEAEKLRAAQEKAAQEERLKNMSSEERAIAEATMPGYTEEKSMQLFTQLPSFSPELQRKAAAALKDFWLTLPDKWKGKLSKKQKEKVKKLKDILGE